MSSSIQPRGSHFKLYLDLDQTDEKIIKFIAENWFAGNISLAFKAILSGAVKYYLADTRPIAKYKTEKFKEFILSLSIHDKYGFFQNLNSFDNFGIHVNDEPKNEDEKEFLKPNDD